MASEVDHPRDDVARYLEALRAWRFPPEGPLDPGGDADRYTGWRRVVANRVPGTLITGVRLALTRLRMLGSPTAAEEADGPIRLHLGCGERPVPGWINVDLAGARADLVWDLRRPLPFAPASVDAIFHEHFLEHLPVDDAVESLRTCRDLLRPGGVLRIGVPDFAAHVTSYLGEDPLLDDLRPDRPTRLLALNELLYDYGHRSMWDRETLELTLREVGFADVAACRAGESVLDPAPDTPAREDGTLYVEAVTPR